LTDGVPGLDDGRRAAALRELPDQRFRHIGDGARTASHHRARPHHAHAPMAFDHRDVRIAKLARVRAVAANRESLSSAMTDRQHIARIAAG